MIKIISRFTRYIAIIALLSLCCLLPWARAEEAKAVEANFTVQTIATGLETPWAMAFTPDGRLFITERPGRLRVLENGVLRPEPVATFDVSAVQETGLMGLALHPRFARNHWLYVAYAYQDKKSGKAVRVERYREAGNALSERKTIIEGLPAARYHAGCRIRFGPDRKLYITTGDATEGFKAQRLDTLNGKTLRLNDDGTIPGDNPFASTAGARAEIFSYGHRNAQGLDWQPGTDLCSRPSTAQPRFSTAWISSTPTTAAMRSTSWRRAITTAGRSSTTNASAPSWKSPCCNTRPR